MSPDKHSFLHIHPKDNVLVALQDLKAGASIDFEGENFALTTDIAAKHKFSLLELQPEDPITMYGVLVGKATQHIPKGGPISTQTVRHASGEFHLSKRKLDWHKPETGKFEGRTFKGYHRPDGSVGTGNYWIVVPLVFCENRNINVLKDALTEKLGYKKAKSYETDVDQLISLYQSGKSVEKIINAEIEASKEETKSKRLFKNIDGIKFLTHEMGCGCTRSDAQTLCGLI